jgi:tRNA A-37 threonylcarbamoyl transferase component Bud32
LGLSNAKTPVEVLLVIHDFQPRLMNYVKVSGEKKVFVFAVDEWVFERDVDRGFLGEALAGGLVFPYRPLFNEVYLHVQEVRLKKRLTLELLENLVLDFPELSYAIHIRPEYFMYETMLSRTRLFPPMIYSLLNFTREDVKNENIRNVLRGYLEALKELEEEKLVNFSKGYVKISKNFVDNSRSRKTRFINLFKPAQKALFMSSLGIFPKILSLLSENKEIFLKLQRLTEENSKIIHQIEDPQRYLYVPTASGLVPLASGVDIEAFARKVLSAGKYAEVSIEKIGGVLNDAFLIRTCINGKERRIVVKRFKDWSSFKWFPLTLWTVGTRTFAVLGRSRLERECAINQLLYSKGFNVPKLLYINHAERLVFMEYVEGESIEKVLRRIMNSKTGEAKNDLTIIEKVGEKFAEVHALGISLGDTKPENILIGKKGEIYLLDFEQASRNGDKAWDVAEFLYYAGHYVSPFVGKQSTEVVTKAFIQGYLKAGGNAKIVKEAGGSKYTKVFSVFTFPHIIFVIANICKKAGRLKE